MNSNQTFELRSFSCLKTIVLAHCLIGMLFPVAVQAEMEDVEFAAHGARRTIQDVLIKTIGDM